MDNIEIIREALLSLAQIPMCIALVLFPSIYKRILKPFDKLFAGEGFTFEHGVWFFSPIMRLSQYTLCIVFPNRSKNDAYAKLVYKGYDFRGHSNATQIRLSYLYVYSMLIGIFFGFIFFVYDLLIVPFLV